jgi:putative phosphoesterase
MRRVVERTPADLVLHLGDGVREFERLSETVESRSLFLAVRGNCDGVSEWPLERVFEREGFRFLMLHGHTHQVKHGTELLTRYAEAKEIDVVFYGHTHRAEDRYLPAEGGTRPLRLFNPGSIGAPWRDEASYGYIEIRNGMILTNVAAYE